MTPTEVAAFLRNYNVWRRGNLDDQPMPDPRQIGEAIDAAIELLDRLEAAEKDIAIKEEVIDSLAAVIKRLDAQCDAAEKSDAESIAMYRKARDERDALRAENAALVDDMNLLRNNNMALRAKIEAMEKQVPVEVVGLYNFMCAAFVPMTPQQEQIAVQLELAKRAMLAAAPEAKP